MIKIDKTEDSICEVCISSGKGNLLNREDIYSLLSLVRSIKNDNPIKGLLIRGDNRCFSTGLAAANLPADELNDLFALFDTLLLELFSCPKPVVVALDGHSIGGGLLLQCCADYVIAADSNKIKIGLPELKIGLTIDELMIALLKFNTGGVRILQELLYCGQYIGVERAQKIGLIDCIVAQEQLSEVAMVEMRKLLSYDVKAFNVTKSRLRAHTSQRMSAALNAKCYEIFNQLK